MTCIKPPLVAYLERNSLLTLIKRYLITCKWLWIHQQSALCRGVQKQLFSTFAKFPCVSFFRKAAFSICPKSIYEKSFRRFSVFSMICNSLSSKNKYVKLHLFKFYDGISRMTLTQVARTFSLIRYVSVIQAGKHQIWLNLDLLASFLSAPSGTVP